MARSSKGQQVKTFKHSEPQPDLSDKLVVGKVYFDATHGEFSIYPPEHITLLQDALTDERDERNDTRFWAGRVYSKTLDGVLQHYETIRRRYIALLRAENKTKVIRFTYSSNLDWKDGHHQKYRNGMAGGINAHRSGISFCGSPALHLKYEVLYEAGGKYYRQFTTPRPFTASDQSDEETRLEYVSHTESRDGQIIPWTAEREEFFARMTGSLESLIMRIDEFSSHLTENVDWAIEQANKMLLLPPPSEDR